MERDTDDIEVLLDLAGVTTVDDALDVVEAAYGANRIPPKTALIVESVLAADNKRA